MTCRNGIKRSRVDAIVDERRVSALTASSHEGFAGGLRVDDDTIYQKVRAPDRRSPRGGAEVVAREDVVEVPDHGPPCDPSSDGGYHERFLRVGEQHVVVTCLLDKTANYVW